MKTLSRPSPQGSQFGTEGVVLFHIFMFKNYKILHL